MTCTCASLVTDQPHKVGCPLFEAPPAPQASDYAHARENGIGHLRADGPYRAEKGRVTNGDFVVCRVTPGWDEGFIAEALNRRVLTGHDILKGDQVALSIDVLHRFAEGSGPFTPADARRMAATWEAAQARPAGAVGLAAEEDSTIVERFKAAVCGYGMSHGFVDSALEKLRGSGLRLVNAPTVSRSGDHRLLAAVDMLDGCGVACLADGRKIAEALRECLAEQLLAVVPYEDIDPPVCRLQLPDGTVPGNAREGAEGWHAAYEAERQAHREHVAEWSWVQEAFECGELPLDLWGASRGAAAQKWIARLQGDLKAERERTEAVRVATEATRDEWRFRALSAERELERVERDDEPARRYDPQTVAECVDRVRRIEGEGSPGERTKVAIPRCLVDFLAETGAPDSDPPGGKVKAECYGTGCDEFPVRDRADMGQGSREQSFSGVTSRQHAERLARSYNPRGGEHAQWRESVERVRIGEWGEATATFTIKADPLEREAGPYRVEGPLVLSRDGLVIASCSTTVTGSLATRRYGMRAQMIADALNAVDGMTCPYCADLGHAHAPDCPTLATERKCRICGCTEANACEIPLEPFGSRPCGWAEVDLCDGPLCLSAAATGWEMSTASERERRTGQPQFKVTVVANTGEELRAQLGDVLANITPPERKAWEKPEVRLIVGDDLTKVLPAIIAAAVERMRQQDRDNQRRRPL